MKGFLLAEGPSALARAGPQGSAPEGEGVVTSLEHSWPLPAWVTLLALLLAAALILFLYSREQGGAGRNRRLALAGLRFSLVVLVAFMFYGWTRQQHRMDLPDLVVVLDESESMAVVDPEPDPDRQRNLQRQVQSAGLQQPSRFNLARSLLLHPDRGWLDRLAEVYRLKLFTVGQTARSHPGPTPQLKNALRELQPTQTASKLGQGIRDTLDAQRGRPTAALLMLTDGITTEGQTIGDVAELARRKSIPLFLVGVGSDLPTRDLRLTDLLVDDVVFVDEMVGFEAQLRGDGYGGRTAKIRLRRGDRSDVLAEQEVVVSADGAALPVRLSCRPRDEGDFEYILEVEPAEGEVNVANNRLSRRVQVRDVVQRVLLVQSYPSYEFRFLKDLLGRAVRQANGATERAIQLTTVLQEADLDSVREDPGALSVFPVRREELSAYDVLIFGDVNPSFLSTSAMENVVEFVMDRGGGAIFLAGPSFTPLAYRDTPLARLLPIEIGTAAAPPEDEFLVKPFVVRPTPLGLTTPFLQLGETAAETESLWQRLPGLHWLLAAPDVRPGARVLAVHPARTGPQGEPLPVILLQFAGAGKVLLHATDETYRWSRFPGDQRFYSRYWLQALRYLSRSPLASPGQSLQVSTDRQQYERGEVVRIRVRFADERQAPAEDDGVTVVVQQGGGRQHQTTLRRDPIRRQLFEGTISDLSDGQYRVWPATPSSPATACTFTIAAPPGEQARLAMDSTDLRRGAKVSQGRFYAFRDAARILQDLPRGRRVSIESLPPQPLWNSNVLAAAFVILITTEWLLRKRSGML